MLCVQAVTTRLCGYITGVFTCILWKNSHVNSKHANGSRTVKWTELCDVTTLSRGDKLLRGELRVWWSKARTRKFKERLLEPVETMSIWITCKDVVCCKEIFFLNWLTSCCSVSHWTTEHTVFVFLWSILPRCPWEQFQFRTHHSFEFRSDELNQYN